MKATSYAMDTEKVRISGMKVAAAGRGSKYYKLGVYYCQWTFCLNVGAVRSGALQFNLSDRRFVGAHRKHLVLTVALMGWVDDPVVRIVAGDIALLIHRLIRVRLPAKTVWLMHFRHHVTLKPANAYSPSRKDTHGFFHPQLRLFLQSSSL